MCIHPMAAMLSGKKTRVASGSYVICKVCSSTMVECDARKFSNYFQELEKKLHVSCQENERIDRRQWMIHTLNCTCRSIELHIHH